METINPPTFEDPLSGLSAPVRLGRRHAGRGALWAKLQGMEASLHFLERHPQTTPEVRSQSRQLRERLGQASEYLAGARHGLFFHPDVFLGVVQEVAADMLLLMPVDMLAVEARGVEEQFHRNIHDPIARATWLGSDEKPGPLREATQWVAQRSVQTEGLGAEETSRLLQARHVLRNALRMVNEHSDMHSRQLSFALLIRIWSCVLLLGMFLVSVMVDRSLWLENNGEAKTELLGLSLLGAAGAIVANMISETPMLVSSGPLWRHVVYYLFVRPALGAFAAFLFYLLERSQLLFGFTAGNGDATQQGHPPIRIVLGGAQAIEYAYALISIAVGFSAEKLLGATMDRVLGRLFSMADKSVSSPSVPSNLPPTPLSNR